MPILRWMRQTESSMPSLSRACFHASAVESLLPRQHVLIDAVDQSSVEIEQEDRLDAHQIPLCRAHSARRPYKVRAR